MSLRDGWRFERNISVMYALGFTGRNSMPSEYREYAAENMGLTFIR